MKTLCSARFHYSCYCFCLVPRLVHSFPYGPPSARYAPYGYGHYDAMQYPGYPPAPVTTWSQQQPPSHWNPNVTQPAVNLFDPQQVEHLVQKANLVQEVTQHLRKHQHSSRQQAECPAEAPKCDDAVNYGEAWGPPCVEPNSHADRWDRARTADGQAARKVPRRADCIPPPPPAPIGAKKKTVP